MNITKEVTQLIEIAKGTADSNKWADFFEKGENHFFLQSPDQENYQLFANLKAEGWKSLGYSAPYKWTMQKGATLVRFVEGDIYVESLVKDELKPTTHS